MNIFYNNKYTFRVLMISLIFILGKTGIAQTSITGKISDKDTGEDMIFANIIISQKGFFVKGITTDIDGNYIIQVDSGKYDLEISYTGYPKQTIKGVVVNENKVKMINVEMKFEGFKYCSMRTIGYKFPLLKQDESSTGMTITSEKIRLLPTRNINEIITITPGVSFTQ